MKSYILAVILVLLNVSTIWTIPVDVNDDLLRAVIIGHNNEKKSSSKSNYFHYDDGLNGLGLNGLGLNGQGLNGGYIGGAVFPPVFQPGYQFGGPRISCTFSYGRRVCPPYY
ncbi:uncharacterized protein LOC114333139 [Diabrotica virgifera virgifera]|uniref:Uncharacterized protein LOC114333139 n=1 Tax=Diabrotica virgifera virgifera TaxID=50390 RepID=A0A6P7FVK0_DIAVI|nr:uncharacterized protein LOC114333139 [Diabrotica virgifera virgifera]